MKWPESCSTMTLLIVKPTKGEWKVGAIKFAGDTFDEFFDWSKTDKKTFQRIPRLIEEYRRTPFEGIGEPEPLKGNLKGFGSRRITDKHRIVYEVSDQEISIHALRGHYTD